MPSTDKRWKLMLCDLLGREISNITTAVDERRITEAKNVPTSLSFAVDSSHPKIAKLHDDGYPRLDYIRRLVKAYRLEIDEHGVERYVHRYSGYVWPLTDEAQDDEAVTRVTCFDPLIVMNQRFARDVAGSWVAVPFDTVQAGVVWQTIIDRTNTFAGPTGLITAGSYRETTDTVKVNWQYKFISEATAELTRGMDIWIEPIDSSGVMAHGRANVYARRGQVREDLILGWKHGMKNNLSALTRTMDPSDAANVLVGFGGTASGSQLASIGVDADNIGRLGLQLEAMQTYSDVRDQNHLDNLVASDLYDRRPPQEAITVKPFENVDPWIDFNVGDTCYVMAGSDLRGGIAKRQERIQGFTITLNDEDDDDVELVTIQDAS